MAVIIGSARIDERGKTTGGRAGDQTGKEVSTQNWYLHSKGWRVFRAKNPSVAEKIAQCMERACKNNKIGYDQYQRNTLYKAAEKVGFDVSRVTTACETDCSALVRVCAAYAGITLPNFRTWDEARVLLDSGAFVELTGDKYTASSAYLRIGDILVTKTKGHTVIVLSDGPSAEKTPAPAAPRRLGDRILKNGCEGEDVRELQSALIRLGYDCGSWGADGDFGDATDRALRAFQRDKSLTVDGEYGSKSRAALAAALETLMACVVEITGGTVNVRSGPGTTYSIVGSVHKGARLQCVDAEPENGWYMIRYGGMNAWVSGRYARLINESSV